MWNLSTVRLAILATAVIGVAGASGSLGFRLGRAEGDRDVRRMLEAGQKVVRQREALIARNLEDYRENLAAARRPVRRVYACPDDVPARAGGTNGAGESGAAGGPGRDITWVLQGCEAELMRLRALIGVVK